MADIRIDQAARLSTELASYRTLEIKTHLEVMRRSPIPSMNVELMKTLDVDYIETLNNQQFLDSRMKSDSGKVIQHLTYYGDGQRFWTVEFQKENPDIQQRVTIGTSFAFEVNQGGTKRPFPLTWLYVDKQPLPEAIPTSTYVGDGKYMGLQVHEFLFTDVLVSKLRQSLVYSIADDAVFPSRVVSYKDEVARLSDHPSWLWETLVSERVQGRVLPMKSRLVSFKGKDPKAESDIDIINIEMATFDGNYAASVFRPRIDPGALVVDTISGKVTYPSVAPQANPPSETGVIRVDAEPSGSPIIFGTCIGVGLVAILVAIFLRFRRT